MAQPLTDIPINPGSGEGQLVVADGAVLQLAAVQ